MSIESIVSTFPHEFHELGGQKIFPIAHVDQSVSFITYLKRDETYHAAEFLPNDSDEIVSGKLEDAAKILEKA